jgi:hypothetical protein
VVVPVEIQVTQTVKDAFGSDAVANSVGDADADASHTSGTAVVEPHLYILFDPISISKFRLNSFRPKPNRAS